MESALGDYLRARRAALRPEDVGLRTASVRRVVGLRRDEVALLAGISPEYYLRLEQGRGHQPSEQVLRCLARALRLDVHAHRYMARLARIETRAADDPPSTVPRASGARLSSSMALWRATPAFVTDRNQTVRRGNELADAVLPGGLAAGDNVVLRVFSRAWRTADLDWDRTAARVVAALRFSGDPVDPSFQDLVGLMSVRDRDFRRLWAAHDAAPMGAAELAFDVAGFGPVRLRQQALRPAGDEDHVLTVLHPDSAGAVAVVAAARGRRNPDAADRRRAG